MRSKQKVAGTFHIVQSIGTQSRSKHLTMSRGGNGRYRYYGLWFIVSYYRKASFFNVWWTLRVLWFKRCCMQFGKFWTFEPALWEQLQLQ